MLVAEALGLSPPFAIVLRDLHDRVDDLQVAKRDVAAPYRKYGSIRMNCSAVISMRHKRPHRVNRP